MNVWTRRRQGDGMDWEGGTDVYRSPCVKQIANGKVRYSTGTSAPCSVMTQKVGMGWEGKSKREVIYVYL